MDKVELDTRVRRNPDLVSTDMDGETVMMSIEHGAYYGTSGVAARVWDLLEQPSTPAELCTMICDEYEIDRATCQSDILAFITDLLQNDLVQRT